LKDLILLGCEPKNKGLPSQTLKTWVNCSIGGLDWVPRGKNNQIENIGNSFAFQPVPDEPLE